MDRIGAEEMRPPGKSKSIFISVAKATALSIVASVVFTYLVQSLTEKPDFAIGFLVAAAVPLVVVPLLSFPHFKLKYELQEANQRIDELSKTDDLTGLLNRRRLFDLARAVFALAKRQHFPIAFHMIDIDHFKRINDTHGHQIGDEVLKRFAGVIRSRIRDSDIFGRYGGEEFLLITPYMRADAAEAFADRLRTAVAERPIVTQAGPIRITVSLGVGHTQGGEMDFEALLNTADAALYEAKRNGRNQIVLRRDNPPSSAE